MYTEEWYELPFHELYQLSEATIIAEVAFEFLR